jgi:hypothetical protein
MFRLEMLAKHVGRLTVLENLSLNFIMSESTNATTANLHDSSPAQTELVKLLSGLLRGTRATVDPAMTQQMASLVQSGKISQRHVLQVARIWLFNAS